MQELRRRAEPIHIVTVANEMRRAGTMGRLGSSGSEAYLSELANTVAGPEGIEDCARIVREKSILRRVIMETQRISALAYRDDRPALEVVDAAQAAVLALGDLAPRKEPKSYAKVLHAALAGIEARMKMRCALTGVPTGIAEFDNITGGFQPGNLIVVAGRPGMGKSAYAQSVASHAIERGYPGLMFSLEMTDDEIGQRAISAEAGIDGSILRNGVFRDIETIRLSSAVTRIKNYPLWVDDEGRQDLLSISAVSRRWRKNQTIFPPGQEQLGFIIVDYLQLLEASPDRQYQSREREVANISRGLKALAKELKLPIIALAALNRDCEKRTDKRPLMSDLGESGAIERDANMVILLYRDEVYNSATKDEGTAEIIIAKNRSGQTGMVRAVYIKEQTRFAPLSRRDAN
jgi:replicative DNA helicase